MVYEIFDLYGFADLWQKVVRLSPQFGLKAKHLEVLQTDLQTDVVS